MMRTLSRASLTQLLQIMNRVGHPGGQTARFLHSMKLTDLTPFAAHRAASRSHGFPAVKVASLFVSAALTFLSPLGSFAAETSDVATLNPTSVVQQVFVVFKTHFDIGFTDMASNVVQRYRTTMIDKALAVVDQNRNLPPEQQFVWTIPGWPAHKILENWPGQVPERRRRVKEAFEEGRFVVHALPFTTHTESLEPEDLVRGLEYSSDLSRELGLPLPRDAKMTDVPEHTWMLATLLKHAGIEFMVIGCNTASGPLRVPPLFWWEGPDGSRVLTMYSIHYGTELLPPKDWPYKYWLAIIHTGDNQGPPKPEQVRQTLDQAAKALPGVKVRIGRMSDFADAILADNPPLPVIRGDAPDTWIHGPMSDPRGARIARNSRPLITATEGLNTQLRSWGVTVPEAEAAIRAAYEQSLLYGEHTWGGSIGWLHRKLSFGAQFERERAEGKFKRIEDSWNEHTAYIEKARSLVAPVLEQNLAALARSVNVSGKRVVVYNPLPWKRDGLVCLHAADRGITGLRAVDGAKEICPVANDGTELRFIAHDLPPMGYRTYVPAGAKSKDGSLLRNDKTAEIENQFFQARFDPARGVLRSLLDKRSGRQLVDPNSSKGFGQYFYERFDNNQVRDWCQAYLKDGSKEREAYHKPGLPPASTRAYESSSPTNFSLRIVQTPVDLAARLTCAGSGHQPKRVGIRLTLYRDLPVADLEMTLTEKPLDPWPEAGWLCLPFKVEEAQFHLGRLGSIIDPAKDVLPGANRYLFAINSGFALTDPQGHGVGVCPLDSPLVSFEVPGCWKYSLDFVPKKPLAYLNLFNNQWSTNFRLWNEGTWTYRVRLWSIDRYDSETSLITPAEEARLPLQAALFNGPAGKLPLNQGGLEISGRGVLVTALGPNPDGAGTLLRLWEYAGKSGSRTIRLPAGLKAHSAQPVDLRGQPQGEPIPVSNQAFSWQLGAFAPASFLLRP